MRLPKYRTLEEMHEKLRPALTAEQFDYFCSWRYNWRWGPSLRERFRDFIEVQRQAVLGDAHAEDIRVDVPIIGNTYTLYIHDRKIYEFFYSTGSEIVCGVWPEGIK